MAGGFGAAYARLHGGLRHGQRPLPAPAGDAGDLGTLQRGPFVALLRQATLRGGFGIDLEFQQQGFSFGDQRFAGRGEEGLSLLYAACQFRRAADRLAAALLHAAQPRPHLPRSGRDLLLQHLVHLRERAGPGQRLRPAGKATIPSSSRATTAGATDWRAAAASLS